MGDYNLPLRLNTPVLLMIFNRPDTTKLVFQAIRKTKPPRLYIASDGHRSGRKDDIKKIKELRVTLLNDIDWECEVKTLFREKNLGCKYAISEALKWFFNHEEMGIILEDDCLPSQSFFWYCEELLMRYKDDERIGMISGNNVLGHYANDEYSYMYSTGGSTWGWATWRRTVENFNPDHPVLKSRNIHKYLLDATTDRLETEHLYNSLKQVINGIITTWDYQWSILLKINSMLAIVPTLNLIKNIGFGSDATHTYGQNFQNTYSRVPIYEISFPLLHPPCIIADREFSYKQAAIDIPPMLFFNKFVFKASHIRRLFEKILGIRSL